MVLNIVRRLSLGSGSAFKKSGDGDHTAGQKGSPKQGHKSKQHQPNPQPQQTKDSVPSAGAVSKKMRKKLEKLDKALMNGAESTKQDKERTVKRDWRKARAFLYSELYDVA